jgi:hypothetical protein
MTALRGLPPEHPLYDLQTLAALVLGPVVIEAACATEAQAAEVARALTAVDPTALHELLVDADERPVALRAQVGPVTFQTALTLTRALSLLTEDARVLPAEPTGWTTARDQGRLRADPLHARGVHAERWTIVDREAPARPELDLYEPTDPAVVELIAELRGAIEAAVGPGTVPDASPRVAVRRHDGRVGLRLVLACPPAALREAWEAVTACVAARAGHDRLRLAPEAVWDVRMDPELVLWPIVSPGPRLPRGAAGRWQDWLDPGPLASDVELELLVEDLKLAEVAEQLVAADLTPGEPRRVQGPEGAAIAQVLYAVGLQPPSLPVLWRASPGLPLGLELLRDDVELRPHRGPARWFLRVRDTLADRDLVEETTPRATSRDDRRLAQQLVDVLADREVEPAPTAGERWLRPMQDTQGRHGLQLLLTRLRDEGEYGATLYALGFDDPALEPLATAAFGPSGLCLHLWYRHGADPSRPRTWRAAP